MNGDFSRWRAPNAKARGYTCVLMQQGRLYTDSDWNEAMTTLTGRSETALSHVIGSAGTPKGDPGFAITPGGGGFQIGAGCYYVNGLHVENGADTDYDTQSGPLGLPPFTDDLTGNDVLIYLETRKQHVTAFQDPLLNDPALSGADTGTRIRADWRVRAMSVSLTADQRDTLIARSRCGHVPDMLPTGPGTGRMRAGTAPAVPSTDDDCLIPPEAGYLNQENQLYRVQIVRGGTRDQARFVWSRENGSVVAGLGQNDDAELILRGAREDEALGFVHGGVVEVFDERSEALGQPGLMTQMSISALNGTVTFSPGIGDIADYVNPRVRRWDHGVADLTGVPLAAGPTPLEHGVQVSFTAGEYRVGDVWMFEARAATGTVVWTPMPSENPDDPVPPMNWGVHCAPLALARRQGAGITDVEDLRAMIPPLTCLQAEDIGFDDSVCQMGADTLQEAIETLCQRGSGGLCTAVVSTVPELIAAVDGLAPRQSIRLCLRGTTFALPETLEFNGLGHVTVEGCGPQTVISVANGEAAFLFNDCSSVRVVDLSANGGPTGTDRPNRRNGRLGTITALECGDMSFERLRLACRNGLDRAAACLSTRGIRRRSDVTVRDCTMRVGQAQIGINVINANRTRIEDNDIAVRPSRTSRIRGRIQADPVLVARLSRAIVRFDTNRPDNLGMADVRTGRLNDNGGPEVFQRAVHELRPGTTEDSFALERGRRPVEALVRTDLAPALGRAIRANEAGAINDTREMRAHIRNVLAAALRSGGHARIGNQVSRVLDTDRLRLADRPYMAQGITVAGSFVGDTWITGNTVTGANDGIRVAASGPTDPNPARWRQLRPPNRVRRLTVSDNTITVIPLSAATDAHGVFVGHVERMQASANVITGPALTGSRPHYGMFQFGWKGSHLTWSENAVSGLHTGFAVLPQVPNPSSHIRRLRDNSATNVIHTYETVGVTVI